MDNENTKIKIKIIDKLFKGEVIAGTTINTEKGIIVLKFESGSKGIIKTRVNGVEVSYESTSPTKIKDVVEDVESDDS